MNIQQQQDRLLQAGEALRESQKKDAFMRGFFFGIIITSVLFFIFLIL